ncbi:hypothetical protein A7Q09_04740 [Methylacidiphilum sp. Yel]|nr:hypothetical protein A7Q09_04740 [Methylacidiphilum sp. Yel]
MFDIRLCPMPRRPFHWIGRCCLAEDPLLLRNIKDAGSKTSKYRFFGGRTDYSGKKPDFQIWQPGKRVYWRWLIGLDMTVQES